MPRKVDKLKDLALEHAQRRSGTFAPPDGAVAIATLRLIRTRPRAKALFKALGVYDLLWWKRGNGVGIHKRVVLVADPVTGQPRLLSLRDRDLLALAALTRWDREVEVERQATSAARYKAAWDAAYRDEAGKPRYPSRPRRFASKGPKRAALDGAMEALSFKAKP